METVVTIVGNVDPALETRALQLAKKAAGDAVSLDRLHLGRAVDILVKAHAPDLTALLRREMAQLGNLDIFVQANDNFRKKKLLMADMDATMVEQETLDELAGHFNLKDKVAPITEKAMRGEIDFHEALRMRVKLLQGLPMEALYETLKEVTYSKGAAALVKTMGAHGAHCVLVSGGFDIFTSHVASTLGFHKNFGNRLGIENMKLTGDVLGAIVDKHMKEKLLVEQAQAYGCTLEQVAAIGDGANDIPMLKKASVGIGYFGKPAVQEATPYQIRHTDLTAVLYMQGYRHTELIN